MHLDTARAHWGANGVMTWTCIGCHWDAMGVRWGAIWTHCSAMGERHGAIWALGHALGCHVWFFKNGGLRNGILDMGGLVAGFKHEGPICVYF